MKVLDLLSGMKGWSEPAIDRGHDVITIDIRADLKPDIVADIFTWDPKSLGDWKPDLIFASPPCKKFSVMRIGMNWNYDNTPTHRDVQRALDLVYRTRDVIFELNPKFFVIENPTNKLRKLDVLKDIERRSVTYCQYGESRMKPTDLWGGFPPSLVLKPSCKQGAPCHIAAPRGSTTGTQGAKWEVTTKVPYKLGEAIIIAAEKDL
jgi:hypothetical protein